MKNKVITFALNILLCILMLSLYISCEQEDDAGSYSFSEVQMLSQTDDGDVQYFGQSVSISGDYAIVGAPKEDNFVEGLGQAYIFKNNGAGTWQEVDLVSASDTTYWDWFGCSVSISGDYAIVGATGFPSAWGQAYIFKNDGSDNWEETTILTSSDMQDFAYFGESVYMKDNYVIVGAPDGYLPDLTFCGKAYIFKKDDGDNWQEVANLSPSDPEDFGLFGNSVTMTEDYAIVGAPGVDSSGPNSGQVYIFENDGSDNWNQVAILKASDEDNSDSFGKSVAIDGDYAIVGAYMADLENDNFGKVYIFKHDGAGNWQEIAILHPIDQTDISYFGFSVSIKGNIVIVGAPYSYYDEIDTGSVYVYQNDGNDNWNEIAFMKASNSAESDHFGSCVSLDENYAIVGAQGTILDNIENGQAYILKRN